MGEINAFDKIMCENQKQKRKHGNKKIYYIKLHLTHRLDIEFTAC